MASDNTVELTIDNFEQSISGDIPILVDFWASWCGPCRMIAPTLDELADEADGRYAIGKVNIDEQGELAQRFGVMSIPTLILFRRGQSVDKLVGARSKGDIMEFLEQSL